MAWQQGWSQMTPAVQHIIRKTATGLARKAGQYYRKRKKARAPSKRAAKYGPKKRYTALSKKKPAHMVKGSMAAKRHMAKIRRKRK
jgi:hypothetical protein